MTSTVVLLGLLTANLAGTVGLGLTLVGVRRKLDTACWEVTRLRQAAERSGRVQEVAGRTIPAAIDTARCGSGVVGPGLTEAEA